MNESSIRVGIVAGETSGDLLGAGLMRELKSRLPGVTFEGIGGPKMQEQGCATLYEMEQLSVIGLEGIARIPSVLRIRKQLAKHFLDNKPDIYIGVDAPDFNLTVEERLRRAGITTAHYVSPTVWAWRGYRIHQIRRAVDLMLALFPFEVRYYQTHQVPVTFVGHPMADEIPNVYNVGAMRKQLGLPVDGTIVALLPGSRYGELKRHATLFVRTARWLLERHPEIQFVAPFAGTVTQALFQEAIVHEHGADLPIKCLLHGSRDALAACNVALLASGTATLEAALLRKPMVVTYRVSMLSEMLIRFFSHVNMYALPNLLAGRLLVPELMQKEAVPEKLGAAVEAYLDHPERAESVQTELAHMHASLKQNADARAAEAIVAALKAKKLVSGN